MIILRVKCACFELVKTEKIDAYLSPVQQTTTWFEAMQCLRTPFENFLWTTNFTSSLYQLLETSTILQQDANHDSKKIFIPEITARLY
jgi:hypothetical protein